MVIITYNEEAGTPQEIEWHCGEPAPTHPHCVDIIQADGDELLYIERVFGNIPTRLDSRVVQWHGDIAKFIIANLG